MRTAAILPIKRFTEAKRRLGASVADPLRVELARAMVGDVLVALNTTAAIERTIVVTREHAVATAASYLGASVVEDTAEQGQSAAVALGVQLALNDGFERVLCIPGDCPAVAPDELDALLADAEAAAVGRSQAAAPGRSSAGSPTRVGGEVVIVPDRHGAGTNGLLLAPADAIAPSFGPGSCERHRALARDARASCRIERVPSLLLDIDTGDDLAVLRERLAGEQVRAARTRVVLGLSAPTRGARARATPADPKLSTTTR